MSIFMRTSKIRLQSQISLSLSFLKREIYSSFIYLPDFIFVFSSWFILRKISIVSILSSFKLWVLIGLFSLSLSLSWQLMKYIQQVSLLLVSNILPKSQCRKRLPSAKRWKQGKQSNKEAKTGVDEMRGSNFPNIAKLQSISHLPQNKYKFFF